jgi:hypothetical protein
MIYILQHTITFEILAVFTDKNLAEQWASVVNYSKLIEKEITLI